MRGFKISKYDNGGDWGRGLLMSETESFKATFNLISNSSIFLNKKERKEKKRHQLLAVMFLWHNSQQYSRQADSSET